MKRKIAFILGLALLVQSAFGLTGKEIMQKVSGKKSPRTVHMASELVLVEKDGTTNKRMIESFTYEDAKGLTKSITVFRSPASVKNTRFLTIENEGRDDDRHIYLPALKKTRRISSSEGGGSFMGTEFTYDDMAMTSKSIDDDTHKLLKEETVGGKECYVIESVPKNTSGSQYSKRIQWVTKDEAMMKVTKIELYDKEGKLLKVLTMEKFKKISGYWTPMNMVMNNVQNGRKTLITTKQIELDKKVNPKLFTTNFLKTGRVK